MLYCTIRFNCVQQHCKCLHYMNVKLKLNITNEKSEITWLTKTVSPSRWIGCGNFQSQNQTETHTISFQCEITLTITFFVYVSCRHSKSQQNQKSRPARTRLHSHILLPYCIKLDPVLEFLNVNLYWIE